MTTHGQADALATDGAVAWMAWGAPPLATLLALAALSILAPRVGWIDRGGGIGLHREGITHERRLVVGWALAIGFAVAWALGASAAGMGGALSAQASAAALAAALAIGACDDLRAGGLGAAAKLAAQGAPALAVAWGCAGAGEDGESIAWVALACLTLGTLAAQNLANTFDNADGALLSIAGLGFAVARPEWAACLGAALAVQMLTRDRARLLLGDAGSHLLGVALWLEPRAWGALALPALDLARVVLVRRAQGRKPWIGDRCHLAHRMQAAGWGRWTVILSLAGIATPAIAGFALRDAWREGWSWSHHGAGIASSAALFAIVLLATPGVDGRGVALSSARSKPNRAAGSAGP